MGVKRLAGRRFDVGNFNLVKTCSQIRRAERSLAAHQLQNFALVGGVRLVDFNIHQKTVQLGFRQIISTLVLNRVLGSHHHEQPRQEITLPAGADLPFGHRFQQRGLHLGRRAVDFVGQHQIGKNRPLAKLELTLLADVNFAAGNVRRQQIRRKLDTVKAGGNAVGQRFDRLGFGQPRRTFDQRVTFRQKRDDHFFHQILLPDDPAVHIIFQTNDFIAYFRHFTLLFIVS